KVKKVRTSRQKPVLQKTRYLRRYPGKITTKLQKKAFIELMPESLPQTKQNHQSQLKDLTTILFPSNLDNFAFANLKKQASKISQENQQAQVKILELESQISNLNQQLYSIQQQTALSQGENLKTAMEKETNRTGVIEIDDDKLPDDKQQITLQTRRRNYYNQLVKSENQAKQYEAQIKIAPK
ncbi:8806_t:CDS:2, partial [Racocetra persica]